MNNHVLVGELWRLVEAPKVNLDTKTVYYCVKAIMAACNVDSSKDLALLSELRKILGDLKQINIAIKELEDEATAEEIEGLKRKIEVLRERLGK